MVNIMLAHVLSFRQGQIAGTPSPPARGLRSLRTSNRPRSTDSTFQEVTFTPVGPKAWFVVAWRV
jgi:hypothetical protein